MEENKREKLVKDAERSLLITMAVGFGFGLVGLIGYPLQIDGVGKTLLFIGILIACAAFIVGFFTGTLFGIPKRNNEGKSNYALNNSLVEIADWLTKIIVGLGLVNLRQVPAYLLGIGATVAKATNLVNTSADVFSMCVVVYFSVLGLYVGYNYMRLVLSAKYKDADDNMVEQLQLDLEKQKEEVEKQKEQVDILKGSADEMKNILNAPQKDITEIKEKAMKSLPDNVAENKVDFIDQMVTAAYKKLSDGRIKNKEKDDPQKSMWGGLSENNNRKLSAVVNSRSKFFYQIILKVESTDPVNHPLNDDDVILFALHDTWNPAYRLINVENGRAELTLYSYGSFTVGVFVDKGSTELELDLSEVPGVNDYFKIH